MFHRPGSVSTLRRPAVAIAVLAACGIAGCQKSADDAADALANTSWRLVEIQSMDDATGVKRPEDPSLYTMRLNADGSVSMRLNCNSATGNWKAVPAPTDPSSGQFEFGPLAATSALCPPPSLDEQISGQAQFVRGYLLKDGRLNLSLMADGGIFVWEPHTE
jgi:heat shock protein HslJ